MSAQRLSDKSVRRIERSTGLTITRAWSFGGYFFEFVVADPEHPEGHRHGSWAKKTGDWVLFDDANRHFNTCAELFPVG